ncbi:hypothetical protein ACFLYU_04720, partial [Candidatus Dependentiae bacterium]
CTTTCNCTEKKYAIKGDATLYGKYGNDIIVPIGETQSRATIHGPVEDAAGLILVDNGEDAYYGVNHNVIMDLVDTDTAITSIQPVLVNKCMLNMCKSPSAVTHKLFAHMSYAWKDADERWLPFLGLGAEVEFAQRSKCCNDCCGCDCDCNCDCNSCCQTNCNNSCNTCNSCCNDSCCDDCCKKAGVYQWGLWLKGGVSFD